MYETDVPKYNIQHLQHLVKECNKKRMHLINKMKSQAKLVKYITKFIQKIAHYEKKKQMKKKLFKRKYQIRDVVRKKRSEPEEYTMEKTQHRLSRAYPFALTMYWKSQKAENKIRNLEKDEELLRSKLFDLERKFTLIKTQLLQQRIGQLKKEIVNDGFEGEGTEMIFPNQAVQRHKTRYKLNKRNWKVKQEKMGNEFTDDKMENEHLSDKDFVKHANKGLHTKKRNHQLRQKPLDRVDPTNQGDLQDSINNMTNTEERGNEASVINIKKESLRRRHQNVPINNKPFLPTPLDVSKEDTVIMPEESSKDERRSKLKTNRKKLSTNKRKSSNARKSNNAKKITELSLVDDTNSTGSSNSDKRNYTFNEKEKKFKLAEPQKVSSLSELQLKSNKKLKVASKFGKPSKKGKPKLLPNKMSGTQNHSESEKIENNENSNKVTFKEEKQLSNDKTISKTLPEYPTLANAVEEEEAEVSSLFKTNTSQTNHEVPYENENKNLNEKNKFITKSTLSLPSLTKSKSYIAPKKTASALLKAKIGVASTVTGLLQRAFRIKQIERHPHSKRPISLIPKKSMETTSSHHENPLEEEDIGQIYKTKGYYKSIEAIKRRSEYMRKFTKLNAEPISVEFHFSLPEKTKPLPLKFTANKKSHKKGKSKNKQKKKDEMNVTVKNEKHELRPPYDKEYFQNLLKNELDSMKREKLSPQQRKEIQNRQFGGKNKSYLHKTQHYNAKLQTFLPLSIQTEELFKNLNALFSEKTLLKTNNEFNLTELQKDFVEEQMNKSISMLINSELEPQQSRKITMFDIWERNDQDITKYFAPTSKFNKIPMEYLQ